MPPRKLKRPVFPKHPEPLPDDYEPPLLTIPITPDLEDTLNLVLADTKGDPPDFVGLAQAALADYLRARGYDVGPTQRRRAASAGEQGRGTTPRHAQP